VVVLSGQLDRESAWVCVNAVESKRLRVGVRNTNIWQQQMIVCRDENKGAALGAVFPLLLAQTTCCRSGVRANQ
jgi:hypothetical protein